MCHAVQKTIEKTRRFCGNECLDRPCFSTCFLKELASISVATTVLLIAGQHQIQPVIPAEVASDFWGGFERVMEYKLPVDAMGIKPTICTLEVRNTADIRTAAIELCKQSTQISLARQLVEVQVVVPMSDVVKVDEIVKRAQPEPCESCLAADTPLQMETRG